MRDSQRSRVYKAELVLEPTEKFDSLGDLMKYFKQIERSKFIQDMAPNLTIWIVDGRGRRRAGCDRITETISKLSFPRSQRNQRMVLHELAHALINYTLEGKERASHGIEFCSMYVKLVSRFIGRDACFKLKESFRVNKVQYE
jgi:putative metallohydrolase (TIGR04338 family)